MPMAIILDTNVASEINRERPHPIVLSWWDNLDVEVFTTAVNEAEMLYGLAITAPGRRRDRLILRTDYLLYTFLAGRILPFDSTAAKIYAEIYASRRRRGCPIGVQACQIAAIAYVHGRAVAIRNTDDFTDCGIELIDPWSTEGATE